MYCVYFITDIPRNRDVIIVDRGPHIVEGGITTKIWPDSYTYFSIRSEMNSKCSLKLCINQFRGGARENNNCN